MNKYAENYLIAKAAYDASVETENEMEEKFLSEKGYPNKRIFTIENEQEFDRLNEEFAVILEKKGMQSIRYEALEKMKAAEKELIRFSLSIVPAKEKAILEKAAKTNWKVRQQIIDLAIRYEPAL